MGRILYYVHDPMCSWCWAFRPTWLRIVESLPKDIACRRLLGGLAQDSDDPMSAEMQHWLSNTWHKIQQRVPGTRFNFAFWEKCLPRRSTYPACRAVIAARQQGEAYEEPMILGIQQAYYLEARNPSDDATLVSIAVELGLDRKRFAADLNAVRTRSLLEEEIHRSLSLGARGFPSLILETPEGLQTLRYDYRDAQAVLAQL